MIVLGIDPGGKSTGCVLRDGETLLDWQLVERDRETVDRWANRCVDVAGHLVANLHVDLVAIEGLNPPTPQMGTTSVLGLMDTATVIGAMLGWVADPAFGAKYLLVPPDRHGRAAEGYGRTGLLAAYPDALVGPQETSGTGRLRHVRAAWDVAAAAVREQRTLNLGGTS